MDKLCTSTTSLREAHLKLALVTFEFWWSVTKHVLGAITATEEDNDLSGDD